MYKNTVDTSTNYCPLCFDAGLSQGYLYGQGRDEKLLTFNGLHKKVIVRPLDPAKKTVPYDRGKHLYVFRTKCKISTF